MRLPSQDRIQLPYPPTWTGTSFVLPAVVGGATPSGNDGIRFWTSVDGETWRMGEERSWGYVRSYAFDEAGHGVAVGQLNSAIAIWTVSDGRWTKAAEQPALLPRQDELTVELWAVAYGPTGYVAVGAANGAPGRGSDVAPVLLSDDGAEWKRLTVERFVGATLLQIVTVGDTYVASGAVSDHGTLRSRLWMSADGRAWEEIAGVGVSGDPWGVQLAVNGSGALATELYSQEGAGTLCRAWSSLDGRHWDVVRGSCPPIRGLVATEWGFVAVAVDDGTVSDPAWACDGTIWMTTDGTDWTCVESPSQPGSEEQIAVSGTSVVVIDPPDQVPGTTTVWEADIASAMEPTAIP